MKQWSSPGAKFGIAALLHYLEEITVIAPYWSGYKQIASLTNIRLNVVETKLTDGCRR
ncbi:MAG: hypothetical protein J7L38_04225 [Thermoproteales archaeon]|nr:hypothetical protein [Thermoproteales archaeon]